MRFLVVKRHAKFNISLNFTSFYFSYTKFKKIKYLNYNNIYSYQLYKSNFIFLSTHPSSIFSLILMQKKVAHVLAVSRMLVKVDNTSFKMLIYLHFFVV